MYLKVFSVIELKQLSGNCRLVGQLQRGYSSARLPSSEGKFLYNIFVVSGKLKIAQNSYNSDGGTWSLPTKDMKTKDVILIQNKDYDFNIKINQKEGYLDRVELINISAVKSTVFKYSIKANNTIPFIR
jgi:hypothetical protein